MLAILTLVACQERTNNKTRYTCQADLVNWSAVIKLASAQCRQLDDQKQEAMLANDPTLGRRLVSLETQVRLPREVLTSGAITMRGQQTARASQLFGLSEIVNAKAQKRFAHAHKVHGTSCGVLTVFHYYFISDTHGVIMDVVVDNKK